MEKGARPDMHIVLRSATFMDDPEGAANYYELMGKVVFLSGRLDFILCNTLAAIMNIPGAEQLKQHIPDRLQGDNSRKAIWDKAFSTIGVINDMKPFADKLISDIIDVAEDRNVIVHSAWDCFSGQNPISARATNVKNRKGKFVVTTHTVSIDDLSNIVQALDSAITRLIPLSMKISMLQAWEKAPSS